MDLPQTAQTMATRTGHSYMDWLDALHHAEHYATEAGVSPRDVWQLAQASASPKNLVFLIKAFVEYHKEHPDDEPPFSLLSQYAQASPHRLKDWIEAIIYFYQWLEQNKRNASFTVIVKYIHATLHDSLAQEEMAKPLIQKLNLRLDRFGFQS